MKARILDMNGARLDLMDVSAVNAAGDPPASIRWSGGVYHHRGAEHDGTAVYQRPEAIRHQRNVAQAGLDGLRRVS